jgi:hypothetical protein
MVSEVQPYLEEAVLPSNIGLVFSEHTRYHFPGLDREPYMRACEGITMDYLDRSIPLRFINCLDLKSLDLQAYKILLLPRTAGLTTEEIRSLREYVEDGGSLLVTGDALLFNEAGEKRADFSMSEELGLSFQKIIRDSIRADMKIIDPEFLKGSMPAEKIPLAGVVQTSAIAGHTLVSTQLHGKEFPLIHINQHGKGTFAYVASAGLTALVRQTADLLTGPMPLVVSDPEKQVILCYQEKSQRYILHFLGDGDYAVFIGRDFADISASVSQYPSSGWNHILSEIDNGVQIKVSGEADNRLLVLR